MWKQVSSGVAIIVEPFIKRLSDQPLSSLLEGAKF